MTVRLREGTTPDAALSVLHNVLIDASNAGGGINQDQALETYLIWVERSEGQLRNIFGDPEIWRSLYSDIHWRIRRMGDTEPKDVPHSRFSDAGKLMALVSFARRGTPTAEEEELMDFLLSSEHLRLDLYDRLESPVHYNAGTDDPEFRDFAGIFSDRIFETFHSFAKANLRKGLPLVIAGGCGLNCDWNTKWKETGFFSDVFVPPVPNDSGSAIGTAIDAQLHFTGDAKIEWDVYSGLPFRVDSPVTVGRYDIRDASYEEVANMLSSGLILGWVSGRYEIGPRALGNRSILASPFDDDTRVRLNEIKQREQFRPIAPVCLEADAARWFGCDHESPFMLFYLPSQHRCTGRGHACERHGPPPNSKPR